MKFHWKPKQGMQSVLWYEAVKINRADPDFHRRHLPAAMPLFAAAGLGDAVGGGCVDHAARDGPAGS